MRKKLKEVVVPKEKAVFWLDGRGRWHGESGEFKHRKIIEHFHSSIRKDKQGFHLMQRHRHFREKVYFPYEDTPLFVFDVLTGENIEIVLNTRKRMKLRERAILPYPKTTLYSVVCGDRYRNQKNESPGVSRPKNSKLNFWRAECLQ